MRVECVLMPHASQKAEKRATDPIKNDVTTSTIPYCSLSGKELSPKAKSDFSSTFSLAFKSPAKRETISPDNYNKNTVNRLDSTRKLASAVKKDKNKVGLAENVPNSSLEIHSVVPNSHSSSDTLEAADSHISKVIRTESVICRNTSFPCNEMMTINRHESFEPLQKRPKIDLSNESDKCVPYTGFQDERQSVGAVSNDSDAMVSSPIDTSGRNSSNVGGDGPIVSNVSNDSGIRKQEVGEGSRELLQKGSQHPCSESAQILPEASNNKHLNSDKECIGEKQSTNLENEQDILARACHAIGLDSEMMDLSEIPEISQSASNIHKMNNAHHITQSANHLAYDYRRQFTRHPYNMETGNYGFHYGYNVHSTNYQQDYSPVLPPPTTRAQVHSHQQKSYYMRPSTQAPHNVMATRNLNLHTYFANTQERFHDPRGNRLQNYSNQMYRTPPMRGSNSNYGVDPRMPTHRFSYHVSRYQTSNLHPPRQPLSSCRYASQNPHRNIVYSSGIYSPPVIQRDSGISNHCGANPNFNGQQGHHIVPRSQNSPQRKRADYSPISSPISPPLSPMIDISLYNKSEHYQWTPPLEKASGAPAPNSTFLPNVVHAPNKKLPQPMHGSGPQWNKGYQDFATPDHPSLAGSATCAFPNSSSPIRVCEGGPSPSHQPRAPGTSEPISLPRRMSEESGPFPSAMACRFYSQSYRGYPDNGRQRSNSFPGSEIYCQNDKNNSVNPVVCTNKPFLPHNLNPSYESQGLSNEKGHDHIIPLERNTVQHSVPKTALNPLNSNVATYESNTNSIWELSSTRNVPHPPIPQRSPVSPTQKSSCQYKSSASMFMSISEGSSNSSTQVDHFANPSNVSRASLHCDPIIGDARVLTDKRVAHEIGLNLGDSEGNKTAGDSQANFLIRKEDQARTEVNSSLVDSTKDNSMKQVANTVSQHKLVPLQHNNPSRNTDSKSEPELRRQPNLPFTSSSTPEPINTKPSQILEEGSSENPVFSEPSKENNTQKSEESDQKSPRENADEDFDKREREDNSSNTKKDVSQTEAFSSDPKEIENGKDTEKDGSEDSKTDTVCKGTQVNEHNAQLSDSNSKNTPKENQNFQKPPVNDEEHSAKVNDQLIQTSEKSSELKESSTVSPSADCGKDSEPNFPASKRTSAPDFRTRLIPVLDHLLSVPEADALNHLRNSPEELLSHIVRLWGGNKAPSKAENPSDRMREDFLTMVRLLFKPQMMLKWGWNEAPPDQILDDLLRPSSDYVSGLRLLSLKFRDLRQQKRLCLASKPHDDSSPSGDVHRRLNYLKCQAGEDGHAMSPESDGKDSSQPTLKETQPDMVLKCSIRECHIVLRRIDSVRPNHAVGKCDPSSDKSQVKHLHSDSRGSQNSSL